MGGNGVSVATLLANHRRIALDSNVLIYLLEADPVRREVCAQLVDAVGAGLVEGVLASVGLAEVLVGPARSRDAVTFEMTAGLIRDLGFQVAPLEAATAEDAAWLRGQAGAGLADAACLASVRAAGATAFVTNDRGIKPRSTVDVVYLDDLEPAPA